MYAERKTGNPFDEKSEKSREILFYNKQDHLCWAVMHIWRGNDFGQFASYQVDRETWEGFKIDEWWELPVDDTELRDAKHRQRE